jgi:hypothetical protein
VVGELTSIRPINDEQLLVETAFAFSLTLQQRWQGLRGRGIGSYTEVSNKGVRLVTICRSAIWKLIGRSSPRLEPREGLADLVDGYRSGVLVWGWGEACQPA